MKGKNANTMLPPRGEREQFIYIDKLGKSYNFQANFVLHT